MGKLYKAVIFIFFLFFLLYPTYSGMGADTKAKRVRIIDAGGYYTGTEVETALQEVGAASYIKADGTVPLTANWPAGAFGISGLTYLETDELYNSGGDLKIMPDVQGDTIFYGDTDVGDDAHGKKHTIKRMAAEGDNQIQFYIDAARTAVLSTDTMYTALGNPAANKYLYTGNFYTYISGDNATFKQYGNIGAVGMKYIQQQVNDATDYFELTREDANILGFDIQMPLSVTDPTGVVIGEDVAGGSSNEEGIVKLWSNGDNAFYSKFSTGTQTEIVEYILPLAKGTAGQVMEVASVAGNVVTMEWDTDDDSGGAPEGTAVLSTGEGGGTKFLREDGDGTCSWQAAGGGATAFDDIGDPDAPATIDFLSHTQTIDIGEDDIDGGDGLILSGTGLGSGTADVTSLKITTDVDGDSNYIPLEIADAGGNLFVVDYTGGATSQGTIAGVTITQGGQTMYDANDVPGGELGGTFDSFTIDDNITVTGWELGAFSASTLLLDPIPDSDDTWNGITITATAGENLVKNDVVYLKSDGKYWKADGNTEALTKGKLALATATINADASGVLLTEGYMRDDGDFEYTIGATLYVSLTPGDPTETIPPSAGDFVRVVGWAESADVIHFKPSADYAERI